MRPGLGTSNGQLFLISSPYARRGELWRAYDKHFGKQGPVLVAQAPTATMNVSLPSGVIDRAYQGDPASAAAEFDASFRSDLEAYVSIEAVKACMPVGIYERPRQWSYQYQAFCDPAGGSGTDCMTLAIAAAPPAPGSHRVSAIARTGRVKCRGRKASARSTLLQIAARAEMPARQ